MGDVHFNVNSSINSVCPDIQPVAASDSSFFMSSPVVSGNSTDDFHTHIIQQDGLLIEAPSELSPKFSSKLDEDSKRFSDDTHNVLGLGNVMSQPSTHDKLPEFSDKNGLIDHTGLSQSQNNMNSISNSIIGSSVPLGQSNADSASLLTNGSVGGSPSSLWSTSSVDDHFLGGIQVSGNQTYPNPFGSFSQPVNNEMLGSGFCPQLSMPQTQNQRRAITASHNLQSNRPANSYFQNKAFNGWSGVKSHQTQQNAWSASVQNPSAVTMNSWSRNCSAPGGVAAVPSNVCSMMSMGRRFSPGTVQTSGGIPMSPGKYRRSTSFPSRSAFAPVGVSYEGQDDKDLLLYQERNGFGPVNGSSVGGPLDNMRSLEHYLNDMVRGPGDSVFPGSVNNSSIHSLSHMTGGKNNYLCGGMASAGLLDDNGVVCPSSAGPGQLLEEHSLLEGLSASVTSPSRHSPRSASSAEAVGERYSRKVFVGGLPPDIDEEEITASFRRFGPLVVDWPHKAESKSYFPPKGYAFLLFQDETSVQQVIDSCIQDDDKLYLCVSSPTIKDKPVQIRPWKLSDADFVLDASLPLDPRKTVFVGGVPRPLKAVELAMIMDRLYGGVCYAGIDTDPELKYPKGAGRVAFSNQQSYIAAISARFVQLQHGDIDKRVEVKPYVLDDQMCDECQGSRCAGKFAPFFCANVTCLQYYCEHCWATIHSRPGREFHKPLVKEGADRPRSVPYRW